MSKLSNLSKIKVTVLHYLWGAYANGFNGAVTAIYGYLGLAVGSVVDPNNITPPSMHTLWVIFGVRFVLDVFGYFKAHPLPETFPGLEDEEELLPAEKTDIVPSSPALKIDPDKPFEKLENKIP